MLLHFILPPPAPHSASVSHLWPWVAMSMARLTGTGDPPSVTHSTSMDFLSGRRLPWRLSMGESTRFLGGSAEVKGQVRGTVLWFSTVYCLTHSGALS